MLINEIKALDERVVRQSIAVASSVDETTLQCPTPCAGWTVRGLLCHLIAQHRGFAAAAVGNGSDPAVWEIPDPPDPVAAYISAADQLISAFNSISTDEFALPELSTTTTFPPARAVGIHFLDYVVHTWDLSQALGRLIDLDSEVVEAAARLADQVDTARLEHLPNPPFAPSLPIRPGASALDRILLRLGRPPDWSHPGSTAATSV